MIACLWSTKFLLSHVQRHHNEIIFFKCESSTSEHCSKHPVRATESFSFLKQCEMKMFYPLPSTQHPGHYCTFLEICNNSTTELPTADQPSFNKELGSCPVSRIYVSVENGKKETQSSVSPIHSQEEDKMLPT